MLNIVYIGVSTWDISDFYLFFMWKLHPTLEKNHPPLSQEPSSKSWGPAKLPPPFLKIWLEAQPPLQKGGAHYVEPSLKLELQTALTEAECEDFEEDWELKNVPVASLLRVSVGVDVSAFFGVDFHMPNQTFCDSLQ